MNLREEADKRDAAHPLAHHRARFDLPAATIYLDGNSLGALPRSTVQRMDDAVRAEWGNGLVSSWNDANWIDLPRTVGDAIAPLVGARAGEVIACDSVSVNLFKLVWAALGMRPNRRVVLSEPGNFPTDIYMLDGLEKRALAERRLAERDALEDALAESVALLMLTHVHYKTAEKFDMKRLTQKAHDVGALVLWDLSHSVGAVEVDLDGCDADFAVGCGYKYLNGGPGAPGFAYVAHRHIEVVEQPLTGWMGHASPFEFDDGYEPAPGIERLLVGTPPILSMTALREGVALIAEIGIAPLAAKSREMSEFVRQAMVELVPEMPCVSPEDPARRGSHLSFRHDHAYAITRALIARGVVGDFRAPDLMRWGFAPAYNSFADCARAVEALREVLDSGEWQRAEFAERAAVT